MKFQRGDVVVIVSANVADAACVVGETGTVKGLDDSADASLMRARYREEVYTVNVAGDEWLVIESCLRKVEDDGDPRKVIEWDDCPWQPEKSLV